MAEPQSTAPSRASAEPPTSGVIHVRRRLTANFTILANRLAQRPGSAVTVGVGAYLMSVPQGTPVSIQALRAHFTEGEILIARALRELEAEGFLERVPVRTENGQVRTRTYVHNDPGYAADEAAAEPQPAPAPRQTPRPTPRPTSCTGPRPGPQASASASAVAVLAALRLTDSRLLLSRRDVAELAPAVDEWLALGVTPERIERVLCADLPPEGMLRSPARLIGWRLENDRPPAAAGPPPRARVAPMQGCEECGLGFRAEKPGCCRSCSAAAA